MDFISENLQIWIPSIVSIVTLVINLVYYIFIQPFVSFKQVRKQELSKTAEELMIYLSDIVSVEKYDSVPTNIRNYSLKIHLCFESGSAPSPLNEYLEKAFQAAQKRKSLETEEEIMEWNEEFRVIAKMIREKLAEHCGVL